MNVADSLIATLHLACAILAGYERGATTSGQVYMTGRGLAGMTLEDLSVDRAAGMVRRLSDAKVAAFATASGGYGPVRQDGADARTILMKGCVADNGAI